MSLHTREFMHSVLDLMTDALSECWREKQAGPEEITKRVLAAMMGRVAAAGDALSELFSELTSQLTAIADGLPGLSGANLELPPPRGRPVFEPPSLENLDTASPRWVPRFQCVLHVLAGGRIEDALQAPISEALALHGEALRVWGLAHLGALSEQFDLIVAPLEGSERSRAMPDRDVGDADPIQRDLHLLRKWPCAGASDQRIDIAAAT
jgi:hypothetical protein